MSQDSLQVWLDPNTLPFCAALYPDHRNGYHRSWSYVHNQARMKGVPPAPPILFIRKAKTFPVPSPSLMHFCSPIICQKFSIATQTAEEARQEKIYLTPSPNQTEEWRRDCEGGLASLPPGSAKAAVQPKKQSVHIGTRPQLLPDKFPVERKN